MFSFNSDFYLKDIYQTNEVVGPKTFELYFTVDHVNLANLGIIVNQFSLFRQRNFMNA